MIYYPLSTGRYIPEIIRVLDSVQTTAKYGVATPVNWIPGDKVMGHQRRKKKWMREIR
jgi:peroxiredoxin (alkyl hydroperoxide reductase subunit C)